MPDDLVKTKKKTKAGVAMSNWTMDLEDQAINLKIFTKFTFVGEPRTVMIYTSIDKSVLKNNLS